MCPAQRGAIALGRAPWGRPTTVVDRRRPGGPSPRSTLLAVGCGVLTSFSTRVCAALVAAALLGACGSDGTTQVVRGADDVQVLTPEEVALSLIHI